MSKSVAHTFAQEHEAPHKNESSTKAVEIKSKSVEVNQGPSLSNEPILYPANDDLAFPDMESIQSSVLDEVGINLKIENQTHVKNNSFESHNDFNSGPELGIEMTLKEAHSSSELSELSIAKSKSTPKTVQPSVEDKKLLHERKVKVSSHTTSNDHAKDFPKDLSSRSIPENLKKRNDNYLMYLLIIVILIILSLFFYYYRNILNKPLPV